MLLQSRQLAKTDEQSEMQVFWSMAKLKPGEHAEQVETVKQVEQ